MSHAKTGANPVRHFTDQSGVRVVDPNEFGDVRSHIHTVPTICLPPVPCGYGIAEDS